MLSDRGEAALPSGWRTIRFDQIAENIAERVDPVEAETDIYVGLEHLDPDSLRL
jgi:type I restriction enzyme, S subunit